MQRLSDNTRMEGASCNPPGFERALQSELKRMQPMREQENKPPPDSLRSLAPNYPRAAVKLSNSQQEQQSSSTFPQKQQQACSTSVSSSRVHPPRRPLQPLTINLPGANAPSSCQQLSHGDGEVDEKQIPASVFQFPPPLHHNPPFHQAPSQYPPFHHYLHQPVPKKESPVTCVVEQEGHLCLQLRYERGEFCLLMLKVCTNFFLISCIHAGLRSHLTSLPTCHCG